MDWRASSSIASSPESHPTRKTNGNMSSSAAGDDEMDEEDQLQRSPKGGRVNRVCRNWLVHEDSALAYRLQAQEIEMHYGQNRQQRQTVRTDFQRAKHLQGEEDEDAVVELKTQEELLTEQELEDERLALELQEQIEREDVLHNRILEQADKELARKLQETEARRGQRIKPREEARVGGSAHRSRESLLDSTRHSRESLQDSSRRSRESLLEGGSSSPSKKDLASCYEDTLSRAARNWTIESAPVPRHRGAVSPIDGRPPSRGERGQSPQCLLLTGVSPEDDYRRAQEVKDEELALELQQSETQEHTSQYYRDQQLAIEAQDRELAKLLQEKERRRAKKARQKAKAGAAKNGSELGSELEPIADDEGAVKVKPKRTAPYFHPPESRIPGHGDGHQRMQGGVPTSAGSRHASGTTSRVDRPHHSGHGGSQMSRDEESLTNIAIALDPTYKNGYSSPERKSSSREASYATSSRNGVSPSQDVDEVEYYSDEDVAPPYMPIQGQKRQTLEKQRSKKDGCKQQ